MLRDRQTRDTERMRPIASNEDRLAMRRELLRELEVTELTVVVGGAQRRAAGAPTR